MTEMEHKRRYQQLRLRIQQATSLVDCQAPKYMLTPEKEKHGELSFLEMMEALYSQGNQRTFTQSPVRSSKDLTMNSSCHENTVGESQVPERLENHKRHHKNPSPIQKKLAFEVPFHVLKRYSHLPFVKNHQILFKLLRPQIFWDLHLAHDQPLGRLTVQLFTEACPEIVLHFVRVCMAQQEERFHFTRLFVPLWLEGELHLNGRNSLASANMEHDPTAINHGSGGGILSFPSRYLRGSKFRSISFSVSFKPIDVLNGKRIAFGKIIHGQHILERIQNIVVSCCGKPMQEITVASCGIL